MGVLPPSPHAAIPIAAAPAGFFLKTGKLGYHRGASWIKSAFPYIPKRAEVRPSFGGMDMIVANVSVLEELRALKRELQDSL